MTGPIDPLPLTLDLTSRFTVGLIETFRVVTPRPHLDPFFAMTPPDPSQIRGFEATSIILDEVAVLERHTPKFTPNNRAARRAAAARRRAGKS